MGKWMKRRNSRYADTPHASAAKTVTWLQCCQSSGCDYKFGCKALHVPGVPPKTRKGPQKVLGMNGKCDWRRGWERTRPEFGVDRPTLGDGQLAPFLQPPGRQEAERKFKSEDTYTVRTAKPRNRNASLRNQTKSPGFANAVAQTVVNSLSK